MVRQGYLMAASSHPELTDDPRVHMMLLDMVYSIQSHSHHAVVWKISSLSIVRSSLLCSSTISRKRLDIFIW